MRALLTSKVYFHSKYLKTLNSVNKCVFRLKCHWSDNSSSGSLLHMRYVGNRPATKSVTPIFGECHQFQNFCISTAPLPGSILHMHSQSTTLILLHKKYSKKTTQPTILHKKIHQNYSSETISTKLFHRNYNIQTIPSKPFH